MRDLLRLYSFESVHGTEGEKDISDWICKWLDNHNIKYNRQKNNIYSFEFNDKPILSAHLDQVETNGKVFKLYLTKDNHIIAYNNLFERTSLGADDKNGVWIILKMLEKGYKFNFIISEGEELGCLGIKKIPLAENINPKTQFCIVLDRKGDKDILSSGAGTTYCSTLAQSLCNFLDNDYVVEKGNLSDTATICKYCESVNMSVGYYFPHTEDEYTDWIQLSTIKNDVEKILTNFIHYPTNPKTYSVKEFKYAYRTF